MSEPVTLSRLPDAPLVSVIIPCHNQGHFLSDAIESALSQTYEAIDILVVDDGSTDDTSAVASSYARVRSLNQRNQGPAEARNTGLRKSVGECVVFLDADDRLRSRAVEVGLNRLKDCQAAAFSYGQCDFIDTHGTFMARSERPVREGDHYLHLLSGNFLPNPAAMVFRREALEAVGGFRPGVPGVEDYDLCLRLTRLYPACGHREVVADYRQHGANLSRRAAMMSASMLTVLQSQAAHVSGHRPYERALREGLRNWRRRYYAELLVARARENARAGRWGLVARDALSLIRSNPRMLVESAWRKLKAGRTGSGATP